MARVVCPDCGLTVVFGILQCPMCKRSLFGVQFRALPLLLRGALITCCVIFALFMGMVILALTLPDKSKPQTAESAAQPAMTSTPARPSDGSMTVQPGAWFGYRTREAMDKATKMAAQGDKDAWGKFMVQAMTAGGLTQLKPGEVVYVEDTAMMSGVVKIRRKGETTGWWTNYEAVK